MKTTRPLLLAACLGTLLTSHVGAHPYASGVTNKSGTVSWVLNERATDTQIIFDNGTLTNDLGAAPAAGTNTFSLAGHTNFSIVVYKIGSNAINQISSDANIHNSFGAPEGVAVNTNSKTGNFGRIYVGNDQALTGNGRATTQGIYALDAASEDCLGQGNTAATSGMTFGTSTYHCPFKLGVGPDDALYVADGGTGAIGGVWRIDANLVAAANMFNLVNVSTVDTTTSGTNFGRVIGTPNVTGSLAGANLKLVMTTWDMNVVNPPGTYPASTDNYQDIYQYNINAGPLPWKTYPTVVTNPIGYGTVNTVTVDAQVAPDGKYFITAYRYNPSEGVTNVCVLSSNGTTVLWDSKTISKTHFNDSTVDHFDFANTSISISPDDRYVLIQGSTNTTFLLMALTNGVPDVSTLTTNSPVTTNSGITCWASTWDAADNIYVTSVGSDYLRIFSLGLTTTCITGNDASSTNGSFSITAVSATIQTQPASQTAQCSSNATFSVGASGAFGGSLHYQWYLTGTGAIAGATNSTLTLNGVSLGQSGNSYTVVVSNTWNSVTSQLAVLTVTDTIPPVVTLIGGATTNLLQGTPFTDPGATASDTCAGSLPVTTNGSVNVNVGGTNYLTYTATDPSGNSATNTRTVIILPTNGPPAISQQPSNVVAQCTSPATFSVVAYGAAPLNYQWYDGATALSDGAGISGSTTANLTLGNAMLSQTGSYKVVITNVSGSVTSLVATLTVNDATTPVVTIIGSTVVSVVQGTAYIDPGATAMDACAGSLPVTTNGSGTYVLTYSATNSGGHSGSAQRTVTVIPGIAPVTASTPEIIPLPVTLQTRAGVFTLCPPQPGNPAPAHALMKILVDGASKQTGQYLAAALAKTTGYQFQLATSTATNAVKGAILITTSNAISTLNTEGYELTVAPDSVVIRAPAQGGTFYGVQSLLQLLPPQIYSPHMVVGVPWAAPCVYIEDYPQFSWRGLMLDAARHFINKQEVKQLLDAMAMHKLNTFHWHLVDDQGWRLEITNYPNLTSIGAWRNGIDYGLPPRSATATNTSGKYGGFYTQADAREIVAYAAERHITVVPEIEMPCHSDAGLSAYGQFSCGDSGDYTMDYYGIQSLYGIDLYSLGTPGTMAFLEDAVAETIAIFPGKYIHCGGDEVVSSGDTQWLSYHADVTNMAAIGITTVVQYQHWLSTNMAKFIQSKGRTMMGWTEYENGGVVPNAALMDWQTGSSSQAVAVAEAGLPVVMSPDSTCYVNYIESSSSSLPIEPPFVVGGVPAYLSVSSVYSFNGANMCLHSGTSCSKCSRAKRPWRK
jgi:hypothetical protein